MSILKSKKRQNLIVWPVRHVKMHGHVLLFLYDYNVNKMQHRRWLTLFQWIQDPTSIFL